MFHEGKVLFALMEGVGGERDKTIRVLKNRFLPWMLLFLYHIQQMMISPEERVLPPPSCGPTACSGKHCG